MGSFSSEFLLLEGTELIICLTFNMTLFFSSLSMSAFHCVPKLNSENIYKEGQDLQAKFSHFTTNSGHSSVHHQLKRRYLKKKYKCPVFCFQGILCHLAIILSPTPNVSNICEHTSSCQSNQHLWWDHDPTVSKSDSQGWVSELQASDKYANNLKLREYLSQM